MVGLELLLGFLLWNTLNLFAKCPCNQLVFQDHFSEGFSRQQRHEWMMWNITNEQPWHSVPMMTVFFQMPMEYEAGLCVDSWKCSCTETPCGFALWWGGQPETSLTDTALSNMTHNPFHNNIKGLKNIYAMTTLWWQGTKKGQGAREGNIKSTFFFLVGFCVHSDPYMVMAKVFFNRSVIFARSTCMAPPFYLAINFPNIFCVNSSHISLKGSWTAPKQRSL